MTVATAPRDGHVGEADVGTRYGLAHAARRGGPTAEPGLVDLSGLFDILRRRFVVFVLLGGAAGIAAFWAVGAQTPVYTSSTSLVIETRGVKLVDIQDRISGVNAGADVVDTEVQVLRSRGLAALVADRLSLWGDPYFAPPAEEGRQGVVGAAKRQLSGLVGGARAQAQPADPDLEQRLSREAVIDRLLGDLIVTRDRLSFAITLSYTHEDPVAAARIVEAFASTYLSQQTLKKLADSQRAARWLETRLAQLAAEVEAAEEAAERFRGEEGLLDIEGLTLMETHIAGAVADLAEARAALSEREAILTSLREAARGEGGLDAVAQSPTLAALREDESLLTQEVARLADRYGPGYPERRRAEVALADLRVSLEREAARAERLATLARDDAATRVRTLEARVNELRGELVQSRRAQVRLRELEREAAAASGVYEAFLARAAEIAAADELQSPDATVISPATVPRSRSAPSLSVALVLAATAALGAGGAGVTLREATAAGVPNARVLTRLTGLACVAVLPPRGRFGLGAQPHRTRDAERAMVALLSDAQEALSDRQSGAAILAVVEDQPRAAEDLAEAALARGYAAKLVVPTAEGTTSHRGGSGPDRVHVPLADRTRGNLRRQVQALGGDCDLVVVAVPPSLAVSATAVAQLTYLAVSARRGRSSEVRELAETLLRAGVPMGGCILTEATDGKGGIR